MPSFALVAALFLLSGTTGLVYEIAFSKSLAPVFGATAYAVSAVLSAFMAGLALGAHVGGRLAGRLTRPLAAYGVAEIGVGALCALTPWAFAAIEAAYVGLARASEGSLSALTAARAGLTFAVVVVPTFCMGATLPLLARATAAERSSLPRLYALNTAGGALGSLLGAYVALPALGLSGAMRAAALVNLGIGALAIAAGLRAAPLPPEAATEEVAREAEGGGTRGALFTFAFASGFLVFAAEVVQTHLLSVLIGNSAYAFGLMLAVFLVCLSIGAARSRRLEARLGDAALGRGLALTALALALCTPLWDQLPRFFAAAGKVVTSWGGRELCRALAAVVILAVPTALMGTTFPLLLSRVGRRAAVAREVGRLTAINTAGTIAGSVVTGYVVLPAVGSQRALGAVACAFAGLAVLAARGALASAAGRATAGIAALGAAGALLSPSWDLARLTNGANVYFGHGPPPDRIAMVREDVHGGITTVAERGGVTTLYTNGKFQGDDGPEMVAQRRFAHFPALFLSREERALVVGLGTGVTLGTVAAYPFREIDVAEISPAIVEAARTFYADESFHALDDRRVGLRMEDGRSLLLVSDRPYDLITIELTSVWFAGAASLYSREFYELCRRRLAEGGVLQQWVQLHHLRPRELGVIVRTLRAAFPHVALFLGGEQGILVASATPLVADRARLSRLDGDPRIRAALEGRPLASLLDDLVASDAELDALSDALAQEHGGPLLSTDDNLLLEVETPKGNVLDYRESLDASLALLERFRTRDVRARHLR